MIIAVSLIGCEQEAKQTSRQSPSLPTSTGFVHYDWLPEQLKHTMDHLQHLHPNRHFNFYYYFAVDDINRHYYIVDAGMKIITEMPVTSEAALQFIDEKLYDPNTLKSGAYFARDTSRRSKTSDRDQFFDPQRNVFYILTKDSVSFTQLRVAITEDTAQQQIYIIQGPSDPTVYPLSEVDRPAMPVRGREYFRQAIEEEVRSAEAFLLYDTGTVEVTFVVGGRRVHSPNLVRGLSTYHDTHEAYQADGEYIKAINNAKVWWHDARKDDQPVQSTVRMTFDISRLKKPSP